jgi:hypothetical protein
MTRETMTLASMTTLRTSDAFSGLPRFGDSLHGIGRTVLDEAFPLVERRPFGRIGESV